MKEGAYIHIEWESQQLGPRNPKNAAYLFFPEFLHGWPAIFACFFGEIALTSGIGRFWPFVSEAADCVDSCDIPSQESGEAGSSTATFFEELICLCES